VYGPRLSAEIFDRFNPGSPKLSCFADDIASMNSAEQEISATSSKIEMARNETRNTHKQKGRTGDPKKKWRAQFADVK
jgi:hypothetical protein